MPRQRERVQRRKHGEAHRRYALDDFPSSGVMRSAVQTLPPRVAYPARSFFFPSRRYAVRRRPSVSPRSAVSMFLLPPRSSPAPCAARRILASLNRLARTVVVFRLNVASCSALPVRCARRPGRWSASCEIGDFGSHVHSPDCRYIAGECFQPSPHSHQSRCARLSGLCQRISRIYALAPRCRAATRGSPARTGAPFDCSGKS